MLLQAMSNHDLTGVRNDLLTALDFKLEEMPEWRAFRRVDEIVMADLLAKVQAGLASPDSPRQESDGRAVGGAEPDIGTNPSIGSLALQAIGAKGVPMATIDLIGPIGVHRQMPDDIERAKANLSAALSRDRRLQSVQWQGKRAWWARGYPLPRIRARLNVPTAADAGS